MNRVGHLSSKGNMFVFSLDNNSTMQELITQKDLGREILLSERLKLVEAVDTSLKTKREQYPFPEYMKQMFDTEILDWFIVDQVLSDDERANHILNVDWTNPPIYAKTSEIVVSEDKTLYVLGLNKIYDETKTKITPIGVEREKYDDWVERLQKRFTSKFMNIFATVKDGKLLFNIDERSTEIKKVERTKGIGGRSCGTYLETVLNPFAEWLGYPFTSDVNGKKNRCLFLALAVRKAFKDEREGFTWFTPAEWEILNANRNLLKKT
jgi:hypothetical protein